LRRFAQNKKAHNYWLALITGWKRAPPGNLEKTPTLAVSNSIL